MTRKRSLSTALAWGRELIKTHELEAFNESSQNAIIPVIEVLELEADAQPRQMTISGILNSAIKANIVDPAGRGVIAGGTTGQALVKASNTDYDTQWSDVTAVAALDDLTDVVITTPSDGQVLEYDSATSKWINATPTGGSDTQVQFNDGGSTFGGDTGLTFNKTTNTLTVGVDNADPGTAVVKGDINLDDGGTYTTTLQTITPTANRTISFPDATGTVALVAGSNGQLIYNNAGAYAGASSSAVGATGNITLSLAGAASTPPVSLTGTWFSGGTSTTTKPQLLIEPNGTTSTAWSTSGTGLGVNAASGFAGNLLDLQVDGASQFEVDKDGIVSGLYFINKDVTGVQYFYGANLYARISVGLASGTQVGWTSSAISPNSARDTGLKRDQAGVVAITDGSTGTGYLKQTPVAVSALPAAATVGAGTRGFVSDSTVAASGNFGATVTGGGSNNVPVFSDGTNWLIG